MSIIKLTPSYKDYIWGGVRLVEKYGKAPDTLPCAESWELSLHPNGITTAEGVPLSDILTDEMLGENAKKFERFPMLIKLIDARESLSVQVHPSDAYALENEGGYGKTEMWYIVEADESAGIYIGFSENIPLSKVESAIRDNTLCDLLHFRPVKAGESYFIPAGTVHAIGAGTLICEIQQNSDLTYRVYDYGRVGKDGRTRELHINKALAVLKPQKYSIPKLPHGIIGISKYFTASEYVIGGEIHFPADRKSFSCITVVRGNGEISGIQMNLGDSFLVTADTDGFTLSGNATVIVAQLREYKTVTFPCEKGYCARLIDDTERVIFEQIESTEHEALNSLYTLTSPFFT